MISSTLCSGFALARGISRLGPRRRPRGFTLIELAAVLAILAILVGIAAPAMTATLKSVQLSSASNDLFGSLLVARSEAIKRSGRVVVCTSADGISCTGAGGWEQGWIVFHDSNNDGMHGNGEAVIQRVQALALELRVTGNLNVAHYVSYAPTGATRLLGGGFQSGTFTLCRQSAGAGEARQIVISSSGRPRVQKSQVPRCP
jgi:type IV fimbrial biogenesis protein FimT